MDTLETHVCAVLPVDRGEVDVVVGIDLHEQTSTYVTVKTSNGKVRVIVHVFYPMRVLGEPDQHACIPVRVNCAIAHDVTQTPNYGFKR